MSKRRIEPEQIDARFRQIEGMLVRGISRPFILFAILAISFILFFLISIEWLNINDFMYGVAATVWAQYGHLYTDVPFIQTPLAIIPNLLLTKIIGRADIFLLLRTLSILLVLAAVLVPLVGKKKNDNLAIWVLYIAACITHPYIHSNSREIGNYAFPLLCLSASVAIINMRGSAVWRGFLACAAIALATSAKLYFVMLCPGIFLMFLLYEKGSLQLKVVAGCIIGFLFGFAPILYFLILDYHSFLKWTVYVFFDILPVRRQDILMGGSASTFFPLEATIRFVSQTAIPIGFATVLLVEEYRRGSVRRTIGKLILVASAYLMAIAPVLVNDQYLAPLALLLFQFSIPHLPSSETLRSRYVIFSMVLFCTQAGIIIEHGVRTFDRFRGFGVVEIIKLQRRASEIIDSQYRCERRFYSAEPLFLLDDKVRYPRELVAGPFLIFLGRRDLTGIGRDFNIVTKINQWEPDIVIWGYFFGDLPLAGDEVDRVIGNYAIEHKFKIEVLGKLDGRDIFLGYRVGCKS